jgi:hypothetical protein
MGSSNRPRLFDPRVAEMVRSAFYEIWDDFEARDAMPSLMTADECKAAIIRRLLDLAVEGPTTKEHLVAKVLDEHPCHIG